MTVRAKSAVRHLRKSGNINEAVQIALGRLPAPAPQRPSLREDGQQPSSQSQTWFFPDQDKVNRFVLLVRDKMQLDCPDPTEWDNGSQSGYAVTVSGNYSDGDLSSCAGPLLGVRLDQMAGQT